MPADDASAQTDFSSGLLPRSDFDPDAHQSPIATEDYSHGRGSSFPEGVVVTPAACHHLPAYSSGSG